MLVLVIAVVLRFSEVERLIPIGFAGKSVGVLYPCRGRA